MQSSTLSSENGEITDESDRENEQMKVLDSFEHEHADDDEELSHSIPPPNQEAWMKQRQQRRRAKRARKPQSECKTSKAEHAATVISETQRPMV